MVGCMGGELNEAARARVVRLLRQSGGVLPDAPSGPVLPRFDALQLAQAIERELERCRVAGFVKLSLHMDLADARLLASALRRLAKKGG